MSSAKTAKPKQKTSPAVPLVRQGSKLAKVLMLVQRPQGATVEEIAKATGWQKHTVRGAISGAVKKKLGQKVKLVIEGNRRAYVIAKATSGKSAVKPTTAKPPKTAMEPVPA